ncbi:GNAT family N-acetyltransferase [Taibaiella chishuiensis]|uniref:Acetyltransferase (GNAT) family protein n=1 Tax=Taibaiella chishuiensis TaxID=1434707 RepID=A0A2P8CZ85_9BACT|nr:GNAT family N-acetyltransferase [Taibaiella chishuiensis]PSK90273.1 acetyltransferase (GNAT) family protein [Taibaiella chishuiensis]
MITITNEIVPLDTYLQLRVASGLTAKTPAAAAIGLKNSLYAVAVKDGDNYIGMGRVIGDGGCFCQVVDICILPGYQGRGLGKEIMARIRTYIDEQLPEGCYISLLADGKADQLYAQFGFKETMPHSKGMAMKKG